MAIKILMPALSPTMVEGSLTKWIVKVGDQIKAGDILAEIETDKATMEIEAVDEGKITKILIKEGASGVPVNSTIAILDGSEKLDKIEVTETLNAKDNLNKDLSEDVNDNNKIQLEKNKVNESVKIKNNKNFFLDNADITKLKASPYVKKIAKNKKIDLANIKGSGPEGRVIKRDFENIDTIKITTSQSKKPSTMRKIIADRTTLTKQTIPHFYLSIDSNVDKLLEMRKKINKSSDIKISINDILVKAIALAQKNNPATNVSWIDGNIVTHNSVDVSIAVALDEGLITPIVKNSDSKGLIEISKEIKYLAEKATRGKLTPDEYNGGTISISNLGMFGISNFSAIINPPQSSILAVGAIKKMPYVVESEIKIVNVLKSTLSVDHRVLDGAIAGKLLKDFNDIIENPFSLWINSNDMEII